MVKVKIEHGSIRYTCGYGPIKKSMGKRTWNKKYQASVGFLASEVGSQLPDIEEIIKYLQDLKPE